MNNDTTQPREQALIEDSFNERFKKDTHFGWKPLDYWGAGWDAHKAHTALIPVAAPEAPTSPKVVCAPNCFYGDCPPCVEAGVAPAAATTASASDVPLFGYFAFHDGEWHVSNADDPCSVKLYRAALTQQGAAHAPDAGAEKKGGAA